MVPYGNKSHPSVGTKWWQHNDSLKLMSNTELCNYWRLVVVHAWYLAMYLLQIAKYRVIFDRKIVRLQHFRHTSRYRTTMATTNLAYRVHYSQTLSNATYDVAIGGVDWYNIWYSGNRQWANIVWCYPIACEIQHRAQLCDTILSNVTLIKAELNFCDLF